MKHSRIEEYTLPLAALALLLAGGIRFALAQNFSPRDAIWALTSIPIAAVALVLCDFLRYRTRARLWIFALPLLAVAILSKHFSIGLGFVLLGIWIYNIIH